MRALIGLAAAALTAGAAFAQSPAANPNAPANPAVSNRDTNNPGAPAAGANSFTQGQAQARIEAAGYAGVTGLAKDKDGLWQGRAMKGGQSMNVALDYQGNVVTR